MRFPLTLPSTLAPPRRVAFRAARPLLSWIFDLGQFDTLYQRAQSDARTPFYSRALRVLEITTNARPEAGARVPASGPLLVIANHPHGMVDGLALAQVVGRTRPDVRVLTNHLLQGLPELADMCLFVNAFSASARETRAGLRAALRWLDQGRALIVFPAGAVAHRDWKTSDTPADEAWHDTVGRLALSSGATVVPAHISGRNRDLFYRAGQWHGGLRTLLLPRELLAMRGAQVNVSLGPPLVFDRHVADRARGTTITALMRAEVQRLGDRSAAVRQPSPVVDATDVAAMRAEIAALQDCRTVAGETIDVYCAPADRMPALLREIGRLREVTFRSVGEGTSREIDLDRFDTHYLHLFAWHRQTLAVAGAYRIGPVDDIVARHGLDGLYTSTLFGFDQRLIAGLGTAVELGRSFVRAEYQRTSNVLMLLWKGIAKFVVESDRYRVLFGPVSISARYSDSSRELLQAFLTQNARHQELAELVSSLTPPAPLPASSRIPDTVQQLDRLVASHEPDEKGMPVLLRQYLRLNAKLLAFNVDRAFGDALDALMMVDLADVDRAILTRYCGREGAARVLNRRSLSHAA